MVATRAAAALFALIALVAFAFGLIRVYQRDWLVFYTEAPVLVSVTAVLRDGMLAAAYPVDGWSSAPLILTLYPPIYLGVAAALTLLTGTEGSYFAPRLLSLVAAAGVVWLMFLIARTREVTASWFVVLTGAWLIAPATYNLIGAAQVDFLALLFTMTAVWVIYLGTSRDRESTRQLTPHVLAALVVLFGLAFFTKQSFVAAPAALVVVLAIRGRIGAAAAMVVGLCAVIVGGTLLLQAMTDGGYLANTFGALVGGVDVRNLIASLRYSAAWQWGALFALVLFLARGGLRIGFAEIYVVFSWTLNLGAMLKTGSSVNYLVEPLAALVVLAFVRGPAAGLASSRIRRRRYAWLLAALLAAGSAWLAWGQVRVVRPLAGDRLAWNLVGLDGDQPLVDARFFPAVLQSGHMPYVNDPFAFGGLRERGVWDPSGLSSDLSTRRVPYVLTNVDLTIGSAPPDLGTVDLLFRYFWLMPEVREPIVRAYALTSEVPPWLWEPETDR